MAVSRRRFVEALGVTGVAALGPSARRAESAQPAAPPPNVAVDLIKLDQNENPNPPSERVTKAVMKALTRGHRYPRNLQDLLDALAKAHGVTRENVLVAAGSGELLRSTVLTFVTKERPLVAGLPTFETSTSTAKANGLPVREIPVDARLRLDLTAMESASVGAGLLFFCNPNNPTGTTWPTKDVEGMIDRLTQRSPETTLLIDEAYAQFVESKDYWSVAARAAKERQLLVTRTLSKAYGLAGMRVGYAVGHVDTIARLRRSTTSGFLPVTSVAAALAALED
jgi:histidinol-phosphate aminotransferase